MLGVLSIQNFKIFKRIIIPCQFKLIKYGFNCRLKPKQKHELTKTKTFWTRVYIEAYYYMSTKTRKI